MTPRRVIIDEVDADTLAKIIATEVERATSGLRGEIELLRDALHAARPVVTHTEAVRYFDRRVTPETICQYILKGGLPAEKQGQTWFILKDDLFRWQTSRYGAVAV